MYVDASALTAILLGEPDAPALAARLERDARRMTCPFSVSETSLAIARAHGRPASEVHADVLEYLSLAAIQVLAVPPQAAQSAVDAAERFGETAGAPGLSLTQCFAYAVSRYYRRPLLYSGSAFALTDIEPA